MVTKGKGSLDAYLGDAREQLETAERLLLSLEAEERVDDYSLDELFRSIHTVKGGAGFLGLAAVSNVAHAVEDVLEAARAGDRTLGRDHSDLILEALDLLKTMLDFPESPDDEAAARMSKRLHGQLSGRAPGKESNGDDFFEIGIAGEDGTSLFSVRRSDLSNWQTMGFKLYVVSADEPVISEVYDQIEFLGYTVDVARGRVLFRSVLSKDLIQRYTGLSDLEVFEAADPVARDRAEPPVDDVTRMRPVEEKAPERSSATADPARTSAIRVHVSLLDELMNLAGELVLTRNQLSQGVANDDAASVAVAAQRLDGVTSEMQEIIMSTRMQPVSVVLGQFQRMARDMASRMGKSVELVTYGDDVELDKSIIENIGDPMTHLVRNAIDHGIESNAERRALGKSEMATLSISTFHEGGHVIIEISDDGRGLDNQRILAKAIERGIVDRSAADQIADPDIARLIFLPGFSTAEEVTDVSGRGVGMDVVNTNLQKLGGTIEVDSEPGRGTTFRIKLPLTLTIVPSLLVSSRGETFAIPQVNLVELVRLSRERGEKIEFAGETAMLRRRGELLPVVWLDRVLGMSDAPSKIGDGTCIAVVAAGSFHYGLVVDALNDSEEIVVKPLGSHLRRCREYAGATILGDGKAALILDISGISEVTELTRGDANALASAEATQEMMTDSGDEEKLLIVEQGGDEVFGIQLAYVNRIERVPASAIQQVGGKQVVRYQGGVIQLFSPEDALARASRPATSQVFLIMFQMMGREVAIVASNIIDIVEAPAEVDTQTFRQPGVTGSTVVGERICLLLDTFALARSIDPDIADKDPQDVLPASGESGGKTVLVVEDSIFFQDKLAELLEQLQVEILIAEDGEAGWNMLDAHADAVDIVLMDVEMPRLNGLDLTRRVRADPRFDHLPIVMLTSLAKETDIENGRVAGANDYLVKMDPEMVKQTVRKHLDNQRVRSAA